MNPRSLASAHSIRLVWTLVVTAGLSSSPHLAAQTSIITPRAAADTTLTLDLARGHLLSGRYDEALVTLEELTERGDADPGEVAHTHLRTLIEVGHYNEARAAISTDVSPAMTVTGIELLLLLGDRDGAQARLEEAIHRHGEPTALRLAAARIHLARGERQAARERLATIPVPAVDDTAVTAAALLVAGQAAWWRSQLGEGNEFQVAKDRFQAAYRRDPDLVAARLQTAAIYLEKYESQLARGELSPILRRNPNHPEANLLLARIHFADGRYRPVQEICRQVLAVNPLHPGALELLAMIQLVDEEVHAAAALIEAGLLINAAAPRLLALRAALLAQVGQTAAAEEEAAALLASDPGYVEVYQIIAGAFDRLRRYDEASLYYHRALEVDPDYAPAANALGLLYMRDGRETEAREWLDRGFELDRFNIRSYNMRLLFKQLDEYERFETPHFIIKVDEPDRALVPLLADELEAIYADQVVRFGFEPERKTTIEIFPTHELLSARLVGLPGVRGIPAACFGPVIASDSPRIWAGSKNWRTVMQHEFGHVLALGRTRKRVPHWFTEGLSVVLEDQVVSTDWHRLARTALERDFMLPFTGLNHGFTRARHLLQRSLAYYKSSFAVGHLIDRHGWETLLACLDDFATGQSTDAILAARLGGAGHDFAAEVDSLFLAQVAAAPIWQPAVLGELMASVQAADEEPDDPAARSLMAQQWMRQGRYETAVSEALAVLEDHPEHLMAQFVLGHSLLQQGEPFIAAEYLEPLVGEQELLEQQPIGFLLRRDLGMVYAELDEEELALPLLEEAIATYPSDPDAARRLAALHERAGRVDAALAVLDELTRTHDTHYDDARWMARLATDAGRHDVAARGWRRALWLRPYEVDSARGMAAACRAGDDPGGAVVALETVCLLDPEDREAHEQLVQLCLEHGPLTTAQRYAPRLLELEPESVVGQRALERL